MENEISKGIEDIEAAIEAILYAAGYPISYSKLSDVLGVGVKDVKRLVKHMAEKYTSGENMRGITLLTFDDSCQFCTREQFAPYIREALGIRRGGNLSASSMEVLAIVAYNQPVTRAFIDTVRGVDSAYAVGSLLDKQLIEACGRLDAPGRPMLYGTTENFLRVFGINSLSDLPEVEPLPITNEAAITAGIQQVADIPMPEENVTTEEDEFPENE
ncbi:MAG: SMC-Scp complex subunit ScpB [Ruminococcaceae bacterium]|nr:SMC-Scp complex subunit ScpB [Oscillospiraceae bacterium]